MTYDEFTKDTRQRQRELKLAGLYSGKVDGIDGPKTRAGWDRWQLQVVQAAQEGGAVDVRSEENIATLVPELQLAARKWLHKAGSWAEAHGLTVKIICGTRSYTEQAALYAQGRTKKGKIVTKASAGYSNHNFGIAFDIGLFDASGKYLEADAQYKALHAACGNPEGCLWGGDWSSIVDTPHYQLNKWGSSTAAVRAALEK